MSKVKWRFYTEVIHGKERSGITVAGMVRETLIKELVDKTAGYILRLIPTLPTGTIIRLVDGVCTGLDKDEAIEKKMTVKWASSRIPSIVEGHVNTVLGRDPDKREGRVRFKIVKGPGPELIEIVQDEKGILAVHPDTTVIHEIVKELGGTVV